MGTRGRPTKEPTAEDRAKVIDLLAKKVPIADLAAMFRMSKPTFRKYFQSELFTGKKSDTPRKPTRDVTEATREKVQRYLGFGMDPSEIALVLGYTGDDEFDDFRADYALELRIGRVVTRAATIDKLVEQSNAGLIGATTKLEALSRTVPTADKAKDQPTEYVGKKAAAATAAAAAAAAGGKFAPPSPPRLIVNGGQRLDDPNGGE